MINTTILGWVTFIYLGALVLYLLRMIMGGDFCRRLATVSLLAGLTAQTVALGLRWMESYKLGIGHAPLANFYESLIFFAWAIILFYSLLEWKTKSQTLGVFVVPVAFLSMAFASLSPDIENRIQPLIPALQSNWLVSHVITCFMGYASFTMAFGFGVMLLFRGQNTVQTGAIRNSLRFLPTGFILDELIYQCTAMGFILLSLGIITGSVWAHYAWGSYWSWDPKETWSLITWLIYAAMIHARFVRGWRGRRMALMAIIGFGAVLFTYLGVNYLPGLHSYLKS
jgi:cytochrome c-type biogenesis protein CcsB